ncbi:MAG: prolyl aminopeptidase [Pseudomonadota bacterium]
MVSSATHYQSFYPEIEPYDTGFLKVSDDHTIYYEQSGNPQGKPAVYIHGGPGGGSNPTQRRVFDPDRYRIILFDQRGCGQSTPSASLENNTTWDLVEDMRRLKEFLQIDRWQVCGGSWGSTLSMAYALTYPGSVTELILRGIFTLRRSELEWYYEGGAAQIFPDEWEKFLQPIPQKERESMIPAYYKRLTGDNRSEQLEAATAWSKWEGSTINLLQRPDQIEGYGEDDFAIAFARIECHYFINGGFFDTDSWLLDNAHRLNTIPTTIIQGRYDVCTPLRTAWDLHKALPEASFEIIEDAGHAFDEPGITDALVRATDRYSG